MSGEICQSRKQNYPHSPWPSAGDRATDPYISWAECLPPRHLPLVCRTKSAWDSYTAKDTDAQGWWRVIEQASLPRTSRLGVGQVTQIWWCCVSLMVAEMITKFSKISIIVIKETYYIQNFVFETFSNYNRLALTTFILAK